MSSSTKDMTDLELFEAIEADLGTHRTWEQFIDELAKGMPHMSRLDVERAAKRNLAESRRRRARHGKPDLPSDDIIDKDVH